MCVFFDHFGDLAHERFSRRLGLFGDVPRAGVDDIVGAECLAIVPRDAAAQLENPFRCGVVRIPRLCKPWCR